ncbi:MAG: MFS transporter [Parvularculaceae bacterium]
MRPSSWRTQSHYAVFYAAQFVLLGVQLPFLSGWLDGKGFTAPAIGLITGAALGARLAFGPAVAFWADRLVNPATALRAVSLLFAIGAMGLALSPGKALIAVSTVAVLWSFGLLVPLSDTAVLRADRAGDLQYGQTRALGSFAFVLTNIFGGMVIASTGISASVKIMAAAGLATFVIAMTLPVRRAPPGEAGAAALNWRDGVRLISNPVFALFLFAAAMIQGAHAAYYSFSILHWTALDYSPRTIGFLWATGVLAEIVLLMRLRALLRRIPPVWLIALGGAGALVRWGITATSPPLAILFLTQTMHALTFAATYTGSIEFIDRAAPRTLTNTAMTLMSTTGVGAMTGLATVAAGFLYASGGAPAMYALMAAMGGLGAIGAVLLLRVWRGETLTLAPVRT